MQEGEKYPQAEMQKRIHFKSEKANEKKEQEKNQVLLLVRFKIFNFHFIQLHGLFRLLVGSTCCLIFARFSHRYQTQELFLLFKEDNTKVKQGLPSSVQTHKSLSQHRLFEVEKMRLKMLS